MILLIAVLGIAIATTGRIYSWSQEKYLQTLAPIKHEMKDMIVVKN